MAVVRYLVNDADTAATFYTKHLGFTLVRRWGPAFSMIKKDDLELWLSGPDTSAARAMPDGRKPEPGGWNRIVLQVGNLPFLIAGMKEADVHFRNEIVTGPGGKQILMEDSAGNPIELFEPAG